MIEFVNQGAIDELEITIEDQKRTLLHIKAELEAAKQYNPFNLVLISGSIENISNIVDDHFASVPTIDEWDGGCARSCKAVDIAAKLQEELDTTMGQLVDSRKRCDYLSTEIESREAELFDLKNAIPDNFWAVVTEKDSMIKRQGKIIKDFKTIETQETDRLYKIIRELNDENLSLRVTINDMAKKHIWYKNTIKELKDRNSEDLNELYAIDKTERNKLASTIDEKDKMIEKQGREILGLLCLRDMYDGLSAELSTCKEDSAVLRKVVEIIIDNGIYPHGAMNELVDLLVDYLDAPEGPPETPIDESDVLKKIRVLVDDWSVNKKGGKQSFFILSEIDDMLKSTQHIDENQDITVTFAYLELP